MGSAVLRSSLRDLILEKVVNFPIKIALHQFLLLIFGTYLLCEHN